MVEVISVPLGTAFKGKNSLPLELLLKERISSLWEQIISFQSSSHLKRDAIEENHCMIQ